MSVTVIDHTKGDGKVLTDKERILEVASNLEGFFADLTAELIGPDGRRCACEDAQCLREIVGRLP